MDRDAVIEIAALHDPYFGLRNRSSGASISGVRESKLYTPEYGSDNDEYSDEEEGQGKSQANVDAAFDEQIINKVMEGDGLGVGSKRLSSIGDIFLLFLSQSTSSLINDAMTTLGLDGRMDILLLLIGLTIATYWVYGYVQASLAARNKKDKRMLMIKSTSSHEKYSILAQLSDNYILYRHHFMRRRFAINFLEFSTMVCGILMTYYTQKCLALFLSNVNISVYTMMIPAIIFFVYFIALKTEFLPYSADGEFEKDITVEDLVKVSTIKFDSIE
jgi:hypothetical protein